MKEMDLVRLTNFKPYRKNGISKDIHGVVVKTYGNRSNVLFFNESNIGDYAIVNVNNTDLILEKERLPKNIEKELLLEIPSFTSKSKNLLQQIKIKPYDMVELIVEDKKYSKYGIHKGDTGCVMSSYAIQNYVEVDFSGIDKNKTYYGDCIEVKIDDLKII